jgi:hypothetical protein
MNAATFREYVERHNAMPRNRISVHRLRFKRALQTYYPMPPMIGIEVDITC